MPANPINMTNGQIDPFEYQNQQQQLLRRQALANALLQKGMQGEPQGQMVSGYYIKPSALGNLTPLINSFVGAKVYGDTQSKMAKLRARMLQEPDSSPQSASASNEPPATNTLPDYLKNPDQPQQQQPPSPMAAPQASQQASSNGVSPYVRNLYLSGDPNLQGYAKMVQEANKPSDIAIMAREQGLSPNDPRVQAAYTNKMTPPINVRPGGTVATFGADGKISPAYSAPQLTSIKDASGREISGYATPEGFKPFNLGSGGNTAPQKATADPWDSIPKLSMPTGMGESTYHKTLMTKAADTASTLSEKYGQKADLANQRMALNDQSNSLLDKATTGPGALTITGIRNFLTSRLNISESLLQKASSGDQSATIELNKNLINAATQAAKSTYGARMTQSEVMLQVKQAAPNVDMTKAAIKYLLDADTARAKYDIKQADDLGSYLTKGGDPHRFEGWYSSKFPLTKDIQSAHKAPAVESPSKSVVRTGTLNGRRVNQYQDGSIDYAD